MPSKYIQLTATGPVAEKNGYVFEYLGNQKYGYYEYVYYNYNDGENWYIYLNSAQTSLSVFNTEFSQATSAPTAHTNYLKINRIALPNLDIANIWTNSAGPNLISQTSAITAATTILVSNIPAGNYLFRWQASSGNAIFDFYSLVLDENNILYNYYLAPKVYATNGQAYLPFYIFENTSLEIKISAYNASSVNIPANSLFLQKLPDTLVISNGMERWLSPILGSDQYDENWINDNKQAYGSPSNGYFIETNYDKCTSDNSLNVVNLEMLPDKSADRTDHKLQTIGDYYCCGRTCRIIIPYESGGYTATHTDTGLIKGVGIMNVTHYYYDWPITVIDFPAPLNTSLTPFIIKYSLHGIKNKPTYKDNITYHTPTGNNITYSSKPSQGYNIAIFSGLSLSTSTKTTYFAIEMAVKLSNGRVIRVQPYAGTVYMIINGTTFNITLSSNNWFSNTSTTDSKRLVYKTSAGSKSVTYCSDYYMAPGGYINMTTTNTTVYGSSGQSTGGTYAGKYILGQSTTSSSTTFTTTLFSDISNGRVGFKILSGF